MNKSQIEALLASANPDTTPPVDTETRADDPQRVYKVLIVDLIGMRIDANGEADYSEVKNHIESQGGFFHLGDQSEAPDLSPGVHFFYQPDLSRESELLAVSGEGQYDALIAAATFIPAKAHFELGGVRIGAGTGNMGSDSWGGGNGDEAVAALMNTPSFNSRATAQMAMKALLKVMPDLPVERLHELVAAGQFDTGKMLKDFPTEKLEGKKIALIGYGNIGRELAKLAKAFGMQVSIYARPRHQQWIESEGFDYAKTPIDAAKGAHVISPHVGLGAFDAASEQYANAGLINSDILGAMATGAIVINYDRGEIIDIDALDAALASGQVRYAGIDADLFVDQDSGGLSGPMVPYLALNEKYPGQLELLPHAAADTEHLSRVEGACQAVNQILSAIRHRVIHNLKGVLPAGYQDGGAQTVPGIGSVSAADLARACADPAFVKTQAQFAQQIADYWQAAAEAKAEDQLRLAEAFGQALLLAINHSQRELDKRGLFGPFYG